MKIAIIGAGGVGGFFGAKLFASGQDVRFVARGIHLDAVQRTGLTVQSPDGNLHVPADRFTGDASSLGNVDVILFCVKTYDTAAAARGISPLLSRGTVVIPLQNGVESEQTLQRLLSETTVYSGVAYVYSTVTAPGVITEAGKPRKIQFGPISGHTADGPAATLVSALLGAGVDAEFLSDMRSALWKKFLFIAAVGGLTAVTRLTLGEILAVPRTAALLADAMREADAVARALRVPIEPGHVDAVLEKLGSYSNDTRSSLYHDLINGKPMEIEALSGAVVRYGAQLGVPTPVHEFFYAALLPHHLNHLRTRRGA
jgi:2-dehydropantoate 2-reductase